MEPSPETPPQRQQFDRGRASPGTTPQRPEQFIHPSRQHIHNRNAPADGTYITGNETLKAGIRQMEDRARRDTPHAHYDRTAMRGLRDGSLRYRVGGDAGLTGTAEALARLADPNTVLTASTTQAGGAQVHGADTDTSAALPANAGITLPNTNI